MELNWKVNNQLLCYANWQKKDFQKIIKTFCISNKQADKLLIP